MKFIVSHPLPPGTTLDKVREHMAAEQRDGLVKGYRSFLSLSDNKGFCVFEAPDRNALDNWLRKAGLKADEIYPVEIEAERGRVIEALEEAHAGV